MKSVERPMIPFYRPYYDRTELFALLRPDVQRAGFEAAQAAEAGAKNSLAFGYGRAALLAIFRGLNLTGVEVIVPAYLCRVVARAIVAAGNSLRFVDIDLDTYNMDLKGLKQALSSQTRVILAVHMYGYPIDIAAIRAIIGDSRIMILEDSALAPVRFTPQSSDLTLFSFGAAKLLTTVEGGAIATNSLDVYDKLRTYRSHKMNRRSFKSNMDRSLRAGVYYLLFSRWTYPFWHSIRSRPFPAGNNQHDSSRLTIQDPFSQRLPGDSDVAFSSFQARLGMAQLGKLEIILRKRCCLAKVYDQELVGLRGIVPAPTVPGATYAYYTIRIPEREKNVFWRAMVRRGVALDWTYDYALPELKPYRRFANRTYPRATQAAREVINLPCFPDLSESQARWIATCVRESILEIRQEDV